jgi:hypothetical protein
MKDLLEGIEFLGIPTIIAIILVGIYLIIDFKSKLLPEMISLKRYFKKRKQKKEDAIKEQQKQKKMLEDMHKSLAEIKASFDKSLTEVRNSVDASIDEMKSHYSPEKLAQRDAWMAWVDGRAEVYDASVEKLTELKDALHANNELTLDLYINVNRNRIIDFASKVVNENVAVSREEFRRIFKTYDEYEKILEKHGKTNGEVEVSIRIIREAYETHMRNHTFIEDSRGY